MLEFNTDKTPTQEEIDVELKRLQALRNAQNVTEAHLANVNNTVTNVVETLPAVEAEEQIGPAVATQFGKAMEEVKLNVLSEAGSDDKQFVDKVKKTLKSAAVKNTEVEEKRADFEKQKVDYASEVLQTEQQKNTHRAAEDKWENREKRRQYHYNGVKPIMTFVGITEPLNLFLLYLLTAVLAPFFLVSRFLKGTIGALVAGAADDNRPKAVKGFLWTLVGMIALCALAALIYLFLKWQRLI